VGRIGTRIDIGAIWRAALGSLTLGGRLRAAQPWALAAGAGVAALAALFPSRWLLFIAYAYLLLLLLSYLWVRAVGPRLRLTRRLTTAWAQVGDELEERWALVNGAPLPLPWLEIDDGSTLPGYNARRVVSAAGGEEQRWRTSARCERRGVYRLGPLTARLSDGLGLFQFAWRERGQRQLVVYPPLVRLPPMPLPRGQRGGLAQADILQRFVTPSVGGLRDYVPGDPPSRIHWPYVARYDRLVVKEFDQERAVALWLLLDLAAAAYPPEPPRPAAPAQEAYTQRSVVSERPSESRPETLLDLAITLTASLAAQALAEGRTVGLLCDDGRRRLVAPAGGAGQLWPILNALVDGEATGRQPLGELLRESRAFRGQRLAGAALVVITPALDGAWLPDLVAHGAARGGALALLVAREAHMAAPCAAALAAQGVPSRAFALGTALPLVNPPRQTVTARVSPLGRVVRTNGDEGRRRNPL
jgi:uncharacterized protein (DUF58 family)